MSRTILIDTDVASDDAVALILAARWRGVRVAAVTAVSGNVAVRQAVRNALLTLDRCGSDAPVYSGYDQPLLRDAAHADWFHGADGMGDMKYPDARGNAESQHAVEAIANVIHANPGIELITLGPLTNLAMAIRRDPSIVAKISRCVVMGGNPCCVGNVTPAAEYNIWCDPEAAAIVFNAGLPIEMVGWQLSRGEAALNADDIARIRSLNTPLGNFAIDCNRVAMRAYETQTGEIGIALPDPIAMAVALDPTIVTRASSHRVRIECHSELTRGQTVVDQLNVGGDERNQSLWSSAAATGAAMSNNRCRIVWSIDIAKWKQMLFAALASSSPIDPPASAR